MFTKKSIYKYSRKLHRWMGLIIGLQIILWFSSGLIMSAIPIDLVHGKHLRQSVEPLQTQLQDYSIPLQDILSRYDLNPSLVKFYSLNEIPVYEVWDNGRLIFSGVTGKRISKLNMEDVQQLAVSQYTGKTVSVSVEKIHQLPLEVSDLRPPVWKVIFDDSISTTFYMDQFTGEVLGVRSDVWRVFDFFWMLHIMDYDTRDDFNNPLLISFAASALLFTLTGIILLIQIFARKKR